MTTLIAIADDAAARPRPLPCRHRGRLARRWATVAIAVVSAVFLFARLGHYPPWDDEAITIMTARAVWQTGDTSVRVDDHNLLVYRGGLLVRDFADRFTPPLQFYLLAPVIGLFGDGNWPARLPFAICGAITVGVGLRWLWRALPPRPLLWWAAAFLVLTNVELFLFCRQCRYYGLAMMLTTVAAYLYTFRTGRTRGLVGMSTVLALLLTAQYLNYAAAVACLAVDYAVWGRRRQRITAAQWAVLIVPQLVVGGVVCSIWNPLAREQAAGVAGHHWLGEHAHLLWLNARDVVASSFVVLPLVLAAPLLYLRRPAAVLLRLPLALAVYGLTVTVAVPTPVKEMTRAEVRYLAPALPLCIATAVAGVWGTLLLPRRARAALLAVSAVPVLVGTSQSPGGPAVVCDPLAFAVELARPQAEPYTPAIAWVNDHVPAGASVYVEPDYMAYPLMLRAPRPTYAWQLPDPPRADLAAVPPVHVRGRVAPDYIVQFGTSDQAKPAIDARRELAARGVRYTLVATLPVHWRDLYRPERVWRSFTTTPVREGEAVYVFARDRATSP